jgi:inosine/xanthosine triphosphatase
MKKIVVGSLNPVKIKAVKNAFQKMFLENEFECIGISVPSGVSDQPMSDAETLQGAQNRAENILEHSNDADFYIGIEGGIEHLEEEMHAFAWVYIKSGNRIGKSRTGTFQLPKKVIELVNQGEELGIANDIIFGKNNSKQKSGAVGILTDDLIDRTEYYTEAVILALIPFKNPKLY